MGSRLMVSIECRGGRRKTGADGAVEEQQTPAAAKRENEQSENSVTSQVQQVSGMRMRSCPCSARSTVVGVSDRAHGDAAGKMAMLIIHRLCRYLRRDRVNSGRRPRAADNRPTGLSGAPPSTKNAAIITTRAMKVVQNEAMV